MSDVEIRITENGPYLLYGAVEIKDADGNVYDTGGKKVVALCRCGGSTTKPFCDGTHSRTGFAGAERAVATEEEPGSA
jgi:3-phenylpropionate/trans-cinnamate dioxygenase ferredoxin subunit